MCGRRNRREMGISHFGQMGMGNGRSGSSKKGKKSNSDKPKQPQRGLGVAQLEKIRLQDQMMACSLPSFQSPFQNKLNQMGFGGHEGIKYNDPQSSAIARSLSNQNNILVPHHLAPPIMTLPLLDPMEKRRHHECCNSSNSFIEYSDSNYSQELNLDLKLSL